MFNRTTFVTSSHTFPTLDRLLAASFCITSASSLVYSSLSPAGNNPRLDLHYFVIQHLFPIQKQAGRLSHKFKQRSHNLTCLAYGSVTQITRRTRSFLSRNPLRDRAIRSAKTANPASPLRNVLAKIHKRDYTPRRKLRIPNKDAAPPKTVAEFRPADQVRAE